MKAIEYIDNRIERLQATIKRLRVERRLAVLRERQRQAGKKLAQAERGLLRQPCLGGRADG